MSDYVNQFDWGMDMEEDFGRIDLTTLKEEVMAGPYRSVWEEGELVAADMQSGDRVRTSHYAQLMTPFLDDHPYTGATEVLEFTTPSSTRPKFKCQAEGCHSQFNRRADLNRHSRNHGTEKKFECTALECPRKGSRAFTRKDKLLDHMLDGHDDDSVFECPDCGTCLTRDLMTVHDTHYGLRASTRYYRTCPIPRCSFKSQTVDYLSAGYKKEGSKLMLRDHLIEKHDLKQRAHFANLLAQRGYDFQTGHLLCPACSSKVTFETHKKFEDHFYLCHFHGPDSEIHDGHRSCDETSWGMRGWRRFGKCRYVPDEIRNHRRTFLRVWPAFAHCPVWDDIECTKSRR